MSKIKIHIKKGDKVQVLSGDERGKTGIVLEVDPKAYRAIVEGLNIVTKHKKPSQQNQEGGRIKTEAPIHISNLKIVAGDVPTRVGRKADEEGKLKRYAKKTGEFID
jgi:large subunit ribosomal protein L24